MSISTIERRGDDEDGEDRSPAAGPGRGAAQRPEDLVPMLHARRRMRRQRHVPLAPTKPRASARLGWGGRARDWSKDSEGPAVGRRAWSVVRRVVVAPMLTRPDFRATPSIWHGAPRSCPPPHTHPQSHKAGSARMRNARTSNGVAGKRNNPLESRPPEAPTNYVKTTLPRRTTSLTSLLRECMNIARESALRRTAVAQKLRNDPTTCSKIPRKSVLGGNSARRPSDPATFSHKSANVVTNNAGVGQVWSSLGPQVGQHRPGLGQYLAMYDQVGRCWRPASGHCSEKPPWE